jgi:hypothetical protein
MKARLMLFSGTFNPYPWVQFYFQMQERFMKGRANQHKTKQGQRDERSEI